MTPGNVQAVLDLEIAEPEAVRELVGAYGALASTIDGWADRIERAGVMAGAPSVKELRMVVAFARAALARIDGGGA